MTDDEARALGERWIKAGGGQGHRVADGGDFFPRSLMTDDGVFVPDLRTPAALGIALAVVRERLNAPRAYLINENDDYGWLVYVPAGAWGHDSADPVGARDGALPWPSEAEALVAALEAGR